jgi:hypothetical protein
MLKQLPLKLFVIALIYIFSTSIISCKHGCGRTGGTSSAGENDSHNMGLNCLNCHSGTGGGEGCFNVGGTAYKDDLTTPFSGCTIEFYTEPESKGELVASIVSDKKGNFYTGHDISWGKGLYPSIVSPTGKRENMLEPVSTGGCNKCHGSTTDRIYIYE